MDEELDKPARILLVEDNPAYVRLTIEAFRDVKDGNHLTVAKNGVEALAMLRGTPPYNDAGHFDLILLDLNLPKFNGRELLADLKSDPELKHIPVIVLTTSKAEEDILRTYDLHANCYITKPVVLDKFMHVVRSIEDFWLSVVTLPERKYGDPMFNQSAPH
jgi:two-component system, chemotaxis family, response regulator Rcp1